MREILVLETAGCDAFLVDPKDAGLRRAFHLLEQRLGEIPAELGKELPADALQVPMRLLYGPSALRVAFDGAMQPRAGVPVRAQLEFPVESTAAGDALTVRVTDLLMKVQSGLRKSVAPNGLYRIDGGPFEFMYGTFGSAFVVSLGAPRSAAPLGPSILPAGVDPALRVRFDVGATMGLVDWLATSAGTSFDSDAILGLHDLAVDWDFGVGSDHALAVSRTAGYRTLLEETSGFPEHMLNPEAFRAIPADAAWVAAGVQNFEGMLDSFVEHFLRTVAAEDQFAGKDPLDVLDGFIGLHLRNDLAAHLGAQWCTYFSDSTGGGGMASLVFMVELADPEGLTAGLERVEGLVDSTGAIQAKGYVRVERREHAQADLWALSFPGLPVPLELSMAVAADHLLVAWTPQAALAGLRQLVEGGPSLLDNPDFQAHAPELRGDEIGFSFLDSPALLRDGYGWATLFSSALSNAVRSRSDEERQPGLILPPYAELMRDARPAIGVARLVGADLITTAEMDRSMVVNLVAGMGWCDRLPIAELLGLATFAVAAQEKNAAASLGLGR